MGISVLNQPAASTASTPTGKTITLTNTYTTNKITDTFAAGGYSISTGSTSNVRVDFVSASAVLASVTTVNGNGLARIASAATAVLITDVSGVTSTVNIDYVATAPSAPAISGTLDTITNSQTYNQTGLLYAVAVGGGGGGGAANGNAPGAGGGAAFTNAGLTYTNTGTSVTIGNGGNGSGAGSPGGAGGTTNFGNILSAGPGNGGLAPNSTNATSAGGTGAANGGNGVAGGTGNGPNSVNTIAARSVVDGTNGAGGAGNGFGGSNSLNPGTGSGIGTGGSGGSSNGSANAGSGYGAGGGGGGNQNNGNATSGAGSQGVVYVLRGF